MKNFLLFLMCIVSMFFLSSCATFPDGTSVWSGGLWIIPVLLFIGFIVFAYRAWVAYNSGTVEGGGGGKPYKDLGKDVKPPMLSNGNFWFAIIFLVALIIVVIAVNNSK